MKKYIVSVVDINPDNAPRPTIFTELFNTREDAHRAVAEDMEHVINLYEANNDGAPPVERSNDGLSVELNSEQSVYYNVTEIEIPDAK